MAKAIVPAGDQVLVRDSERKTFLDGMEMPDNVKALEMFAGEVLRIGPLVSVRTQVGDIVMYGPYAGKNTILDGVEFRMIKEGQIEAYIVEE